MALTQEQKSELTSLLKRRDELEGITLMLRERARSGKTHHHNETNFMTQVTQRRLDDIIEKIRRLRKYE